LEDNEAGLVANTEDEKDFVLKINNLLENTALARKFSQRVVELVKTKYSWDFLSKDLKNNVYLK